MLLDPHGSRFKVRIPNYLFPGRSNDAFVIVSLGSLWSWFWLLVFVTGHGLSSSHLLFVMDLDPHGSSMLWFSFPMARFRRRFDLFHFYLRIGSLLAGSSLHITLFR